MPRYKALPEYNQPEQDYILANYPKQLLEKACQHLCDQCIHEPCNLLPITTAGEDCPYFQQRPGVQP